MTILDKNKIENLLKNVTDKYLEKDIVSSGAVENIDINNDQVIINILLMYPAKSYHQILTDEIINVLNKSGFKNVKVNIRTKIVQYSTQKEVNALPGVKNTIAIASGKGGVGKSTTAVNIALALQAEGAKIAILDADIYGPSQPRMLGVNKLKPKASENKFLPVIGHNIQSMSIGYLFDEKTPMIWRGPMVTQALEQMLRQTIWQDVDYMIIDLPPGTGDTQLTLSQKIPVSASIIITTPQDIALIDAKKGLKMFEKVNIPILGIIENMATYVCSKCGNQENIFGSGGAFAMASDFNTDFLGSLPLNASICEDVDEGNPTVVKDSNSAITKIYRDIAIKIGAKLSQQQKQMPKFPNISV